MATNSSTDSDEVDEFKDKKWICRVHDKKRIYWDLFIMLFAIWNSIQIPYSIAFTPDQDQSIFNTVLNLIVDTFFIWDIFINFRTTYLNEESGKEIGSLNLIYYQYLKGKHLSIFNIL